MNAPESIEQNLDLKQGSRGRRGRKDSTGDEQVLKAKPIKDALGELMASFQKFEDARSAYNELRKQVAERANASAADLNRLLKASARGNFEDVQRKVQGTADLFELIGEVPSSEVQ
jgi:hypothetical protein